MVTISAYISARVIRRFGSWAFGASAERRAAGVGISPLTTVVNGVDIEKHLSDKCCYCDGEFKAGIFPRMEQRRRDAL